MVTANGRTGVGEDSSLVPRLLILGLRIERERESEMQFS